ncbi:MAG: glycosyltransferase [candidate division KSB1 bacterium]|nr:glycosyltransferase [candidate division KSB1 bacterium]
MATPPDSITLSVIVAVHDISDKLEWLNTRLCNVLKSYNKTFELIYVDDGSQDTSWQVLQSLCHQHPFIRIIKLRTAFGESSVLEAALEIAKGENILFYTAGIGVNPSDLIQVINELDTDVDVVIGARSPRRDSYINRFVSRLFNFFTNRLTSLRLKDINSGVLATRRQVLEHVPFYGALNTFIPVMAHNQGYKITEINVEQLTGNYKRALHPRDYVRRLLDLVSVIFLSRYTKKPLHFLGFLGVLFTGIGAAIDIYLFFYRLLGFGGIAGRPILLLGMVLLVIGLQMIAIGLLGEMIIFTHARDIQEYNIEEIID